MPFAPDESARSLPARSTKLILLTWGEGEGAQHQDWSPRGLSQGSQIDAARVPLGLLIPGHASHRPGLLPTRAPVRECHKCGANVQTMQTLVWCFSHQKCPAQLEAPGGGPTLIQEDPPTFGT